MRVFSLLLFTLLCTCGRAQNIGDSLYEGRYPAIDNELGPSPFFAVNQAEELIVLSSSGEKSRLSTYKEGSLIKQRMLSLKMGQKEVQKIVSPPEGGLVIIGKKNKSLLLEWITPGFDSSFMVEKAIVIGDKPEILNTYRKAEGTTILFCTDKSKTYQIPMRLVRDTMREKPRLLVGSPQHIYDTPLEQIVRLPQGGFVGFGTDRKQSFLQYFFPDGKADGAQQLIPAADNIQDKVLCFHPASKGILVAGANGPSLQWLLIDSVGNTIVNRKAPLNAGGMRLEHLVVKNNDSIVAMGEDITYSSRLNSSAIWLASISSDLRKAKLFPTAKDEWVGEALQLISKDRVLIAGRSKAPYKLRFDLEAPSEQKSTADITFSSPTLIDQQGDGTLDVGEAATLEIPWRTGEAPARGVIKATLRFDYPVAGLPDQVITHSYPVLGQDSGVLQFPFYGEKGFPTGTHRTTITFELEGWPLDTQEYLLKTRSAPVPDVVFVKPACYLSYPVGKDSSSFRRLDTLTVYLRVRNQGRDIARMIDLKTLPIPHVAFSSYYEYIEELAPGEYRDFTLRVMPHSYFKYEDLNLNFFLYDGSGKSSFIQLGHRLPNVFLIEGEKGKQLAPRFRDYPKGSKGGPSPYFNSDFKPKIELITPRPGSVENSTIESPMRYVPFRARFSDAEERNDLQENTKLVYLKEVESGNRVEYFDGDIVKDTVTAGTGVFNYEIQSELKVPEEKTVYQIGYTQKEGGVIFSTPFTLLPSDRLERTLHICLIASEYADNAPTRLSTSKMYSLLQKNGIIKKGKGRFFSEVKTDTIYKATKQVIDAYINFKKAEIADKKTKNSEGIGYHDYMMFYVVGHGIIEQEDFGLITSDNTDTISVVSHFIEPLAEFPAEKFYIIDACHSANLNKALAGVDFSEAPRGKFAVRILAASSDKSFYPIDGSAPTHFSRALITVLNDLLSNPKNVFSYDGVISSEELWISLQPTAKKYILDGLPNGRINAINSFLPRYEQSSNLGRPAYIDYFFELPLQMIKR